MHTRTCASQRRAGLSMAKKPITMIEPIMTRIPRSSPASAMTFEKGDLTEVPMARSFGHFCMKRPQRG